MDETRLLAIWGGAALGATAGLTLAATAVVARAQAYLDETKALRRKTWENLINTTHRHNVFLLSLNSHIEEIKALSWRFTHQARPVDAPLPMPPRRPLKDRAYSYADARIRKIGGEVRKSPHSESEELERAFLAGAAAALETP